MRKGTKKKVLLTLWLGCMLGVQFLWPAGATAAKQDKVTICHRTASHTNPYVRITVAKASVDGDLSDDNGKGDHYAEHTGPVFPATGPDGKWGDIIPPVKGVHDGRNWTDEGQAIYNNGCKPVKPVPSPTPTITPTPTPTDTTTVLGVHKDRSNLAGTGTKPKTIALLGLLLLGIGYVLVFSVAKALEKVTE